jgi:excisionase family DNA binding protein
MKPSDLLTPQQVADALGFTTARPIYKLIKSGDLPAARIGGRLRIDRRDVNAMLAKARTTRPRERGGLRDLERQR